MGSYRLLQQIGEGGMGRVFVAEHVRLGRKVALKLLRPEFSGNPEAVKRFFDEARAVNCISHENIIEVSDFVENPQGSSFYIMELLHGIDLGDLEAREGILDLSRVLPIAIQVCSALGAAHEVGIVHRDLKPDNIFLIERPGCREFVKLLDFGVAKLMNDAVDEASTFRSSAGLVVGTPDYMAPEQALGHAVDHLADVYAMGVILFEMAAGRRPFVGKTARDLMVQHMNALPPRPSLLNPASRIPEDLEELILACLQKDPAQRPRTIHEVEQRLRAILALPEIRDRSRSRSGSPGGRRVAWALAGAAFVVGVVSLLALAGPSAWARYSAPRLGAPRPATAVSSAAPTSNRPTFTVEAMAPVVAASPAPRPVRGAAPSGATSATASPASSSMNRPVQATTRGPNVRRRPPQLDRDAVLNPFE
jgi:serine/threonine protein kinase